MEVYGPIYSKDICSPQFIKGLQKTYQDLRSNSHLDEHFENYEKVNSLLEMFQNEAEVTSQKNSYAIDLSDLNNFLGVNFPRIEVIQNVLTNLGFKSSKSHYGYSSLQTDAPVDVFFD